MGFLLPRHRISDVFNFSALTHCWLGKGKGIWPVKNLFQLSLKILFGKPSPTWSDSVKVNKS